MRSPKTAVLIVFAIQGAIFGSWAPRVPALAEHVHAQTGQLGLALLGGSIGMIIAASFAGRLSARFGARLLVLISSVALVLVLPAIAVAPSTVQLGLTLVLLGASAGTLDVAMNIAAVTVVRQTERPLMPVFHASYSFGGLIGAAGAAGAAAAHVGTFAHFSVVSALAAMITAAVVANVPNEPPASMQHECMRTVRVSPGASAIGTVPGAAPETVVTGVTG